MNTLHKKLSEIRVLEAEELDLVGGAGEFPRPRYDTHCQVPSVYSTTSWVPGGAGNNTGTDDSHTDFWSIVDDQIG